MNLITIEKNKAQTHSMGNAGLPITTHLQSATSNSPGWIFAIELLYISSTSVFQLACRLS